MAKEVIMPKFGFTQESAQIVRWLKQAGDPVDQGDPIAEVTTDKVNMEVEAPVKGILAGLQYPEGAEVAVTRVIAWILAPGEGLPAGTGPEKTAAPATFQEQPVSGTPAEAVPAPGNGGKVSVTPLAARVATAMGVDLAQVQPGKPGGRITRQDVENFQAAALPGEIRATPAARRAGRELSIDLREVTGSGPAGRIQEADVRSLPERPIPAPLSRPGQPAGAALFTDLPLSRMRSTIAARLQKSAQEAPHIYLEVRLRAGAMQALQQRASQRSGAEKVSLTAILAQAVAWALGRHPALNAHFLGDRIRQFAAVNLGMAVALGEGLIVPVIRQAENKGILQLAAEVRDLSRRARQGSLRLDELEGGTFTISNLGMYGVERFTAIINPPQVAILAVGAVRNEVLANEAGQAVFEPVMDLVLGADHRAVDGATAARFLADLKAALEEPVSMLL